MNKKENPIDKVKRKLWMFGYGVKDYTGIQIEQINFDLLINEKIKVKVGLTRPKAMPGGCDVYAAVERGVVTFFAKPKNGMVESKSPAIIFGKPKE